MTDIPAAPPQTHGRAGLNLPQAISLGVGLGAYVVLSLIFFEPAFVLLVALALMMASVELYRALQRQEMTAAIVPIVAGSLAIPFGSYLAGRENAVIEFSTTSVLLGSLALTVLAALIWRMRGGSKGYVKDAAASLMIIAYVPMLGSFAPLMLAEDQGAARLVTFLLVVTMSDTGGLIGGVLFGKHPMAPKISPKKSWEGFAGSVVLWFVRRRRVKRPFGRRLFLADVCGGLAFAAVGAALAVPYFKVAELHPNAERTLGDIGLYSPPASGFFTAPAESRVWGGLHEGARAVLPWHPEMTLLPGFALYALAAGGLFFSVWRVRHRIFLLAGVLVTMALAMGTRFFGGRFTYVPLFDYLPGWSGLRTPGRMMLWTTLLLGLLAAGAVTALCMRVRELAAERVPPWPGPWLRLATLLPLALVLVEGLNATPQPVVPRQPAAMRTVDGPMLVLPSSQNLDQPVMLWSTDRFQPMVNGGSGFTPRSQAQIREATVSFPDYASVDYLRQIGVKNVVVLRDELEGTPWEGMLDRPVDTPGVTREQVGEAVVFRL